MQASHHAIARHRFVVLYELDRLAEERDCHLLVKLALAEALEEIAVSGHFRPVKALSKYFFIDF